MSDTTVRKLRKISDGAKVKGYILVPPKNWLETVEEKEKRKILHFSVKTEDDLLVLTPVFQEALASTPRNTSPEMLGRLLRHGNLIVKLREIRKGKNVYRLINVPRAWVKANEQQSNRNVVALRLTMEPNRITVLSVFGGKLKTKQKV